MKLSVVIVTYYPNIEEVKENILQFIDFVEKIIIWENTPIQDLYLHNVDLSSYAEKVICLGVGYNVGIGFALNQAIVWSKEHCMSHIMTMDQDSKFEKGSLEILLNAVQVHNKEGICIFSPNVINFFSKSLTPLYNENENLLIVDRSITSGTIYQLDIFNITGYFREDFFIDEVDYEYCYRATKKGFKTVVVCNSILSQKFSDMRHTNFGFYITNYSPFRLYHIIRNGLIVQKEYPDSSPGWYRLIVYSIIIRSIKILLFEKNKIPKMKSIIIGIYDGVLNHVYERK